MNEKLQNQVLQILNSIQTCGKDGDDQHLSVSVPNEIVAERLISKGIKINPIEQGDTVYVIQKASIPCDTCEHRGVGIGCCMQKCNATEYQVYTVIVEDVSAFCKIAPNGDLVLKDNIYLNKSDAYDNLPHPCKSNSEFAAQNKPSLINLEEKIVTVKINGNKNLKTVIDYLFHYGITQYGYDKKDNILNLYRNDAYLFNQPGAALIVDRSCEMSKEPFVSFCISYEYEHAYDFCDLDWTVR